MSTRYMRFIVAIGSLLFSSVAFAQGPSSGAPTPHRGIGVGMQGDDQGISVVSLVPGSPAEKAGVKVGDQVVSIAGISIFDFDANKMKTIADTAKTITFIVMRGGEKKTFEIEPAVITMPSSPSAPSSPGADTGKNPR